MRRVAEGFGNRNPLVSLDCLRIEANPGTHQLDSFAAQMATNFSPPAYLAVAVCGNCLTDGSRRFELWNGSIHPGYSGGSALTSSSCLICSGVSLTSTAARLSFSCSIRLAPMITLVTT